MTIIEQKHKVQWKLTKIVLQWILHLFIYFILELFGLLFISLWPYFGLIYALFSIVI